jgi:hypothetical protein
MTPIETIDSKESERWLLRECVKTVFNSRCEEENHIALLLNRLSSRIIFVENSNPKKD